MDSFPEESGPYLYFDDSQQVLRGLPLWLIFIAFVAFFFLGSLLIGGTSLSSKWRGWRHVLPHFLGLWLPFVASILLLYLFVVFGWMLSFYRYPATTKDPYITNPNWLVFTLALVGLAIFLFLGRRIARRFSSPPPDPLPSSIKSFSLFVIGLAAVYVLALNPFSLLFFVPLLYHAGSGGDWSLAVLRSAPVRRGVYGSRHENWDPLKAAARELLLQATQNSAVVFRKHRLAPCSPCISSHTQL